MKLIYFLESLGDMLNINLTTGFFFSQISGFPHQVKTNTKVLGLSAFFNNLFEGFFIPALLDKRIVSALQKDSSHFSFGVGAEIEKLGSKPTSDSFIQFRVAVPIIGDENNRFTVNVFQQGIQEIGIFQFIDLIKDEHGSAFIELGFDEVKQFAGFFVLDELKT